MENVINLSVSREAATLRVLVEDKLREAIAHGVFKPGQRLIERELCEMMGVGRTSVREALRQLEAEGLVTSVAHRGPIVSTIDVEEAEQLYALRGLLEGYAGRECALRRDPAIIARLRVELERMRSVVRDNAWGEMLAVKTAFYSVLLEGCANVFVQRSLNMLLNRITLLRMTSMARPGRSAQSLAEIEGILASVERGDAPAAEAACIAHVRNAAEAALDMLRAQENLIVHDKGPI